jgi:hypothetical protein
VQNCIEFAESKNLTELDPSAEFASVWTSHQIMVGESFNETRVKLIDLFSCIKQELIIQPFMNLFDQIHIKFKEDFKGKLKKSWGFSANLPENTGSSFVDEINKHLNSLCNQNVATFELLSVGVANFKREAFQTLNRKICSSLKSHLQDNSESASRRIQNVERYTLIHANHIYNSEILFNSFKLGFKVESFLIRNLTD